MSSIKQDSLPLRTETDPQNVGLNQYLGARMSPVLTRHLYHHGRDKNRIISA